MSKKKREVWKRTQKKDLKRRDLQVAWVVVMLLIAITTIMFISDGSNITGAIVGIQPVGEEVIEIPTFQEDSPDNPQMSRHLRDGAYANASANEKEEHKEETQEEIMIDQPVVIEEPAPEIVEELIIDEPVIVDEPVEEVTIDAPMIVTPIIEEPTIQDEINDTGNEISGGSGEPITIPMPIIESDPLDETQPSLDNELGIMDVPTHSTPVLNSTNIYILIILMLI